MPSNKPKKPNQQEIMAFKKNDLKRFIENNNVHLTAPDNNKKYKFTVLHTKVALLVYYDISIPGECAQAVAELMARRYDFARCSNIPIYHSLGHLLTKDAVHAIVVSTCSNVFASHSKPNDRVFQQTNLYLYFHGIVITNYAKYQYFTVNYAMQTHQWSEMTQFIKAHSYKVSKKDIQNQYNKDKFIGNNTNQTEMVRVQQQLQKIQKLQSAPKTNKVKPKITEQDRQDEQDRKRMQHHEDEIDNMIDDHNDESKAEEETTDDGNKLANMDNSSSNNDNQQSSNNNHNPQNTHDPNEQMNDDNDPNKDGDQFNFENTSSQGFGGFNNKNNSSNLEIQQPFSNIGLSPVKTKQDNSGFNNWGWTNSSFSLGNQQFNNGNNNNNKKLTNWHHPQNQPLTKNDLNDFFSNFQKTIINQVQNIQDKSAMESNNKFNELAKKIHLQTQQQQETQTMFHKQLETFNNKQDELKDQLNFSFHPNDPNHKDYIKPSTNHIISKQDRRMFRRLDTDPRFDVVSHRGNGQMPSRDREDEEKNEMENKTQDDDDLTDFLSMKQFTSSRRPPSSTSVSHRASRSSPSTYTPPKQITKLMDSLLTQAIGRRRRRGGGGDDPSSSDNNSDSDKDFNYHIKTPEKRKKLKKHKKRKYDKDKPDEYWEHKFFHPEYQYADLTDEEDDTKEVKFVDGIRVSFIHQLPLRDDKVSIKFDSLQKQKYIEKFDLDLGKTSLLYSLKRDKVLKKFKKIKIVYENDEERQSYKLNNIIRQSINTNKGKQQLGTDYVTKFIEALKSRIYLMNNIVNPVILEAADYIKQTINIRFVELQRQLHVLESQQKIYKHFAEIYQRNPTTIVFDLLKMGRIGIDSLMKNINITISLLEYDCRINHKITNALEAAYIMMKKEPQTVRLEAAQHIQQQSKTVSTVTLAKEEPPKPSTHYIPPTLRPLTVPTTTPTTTSTTPTVIYPYEQDTPKPHIDKQMEQAHKKLDKIYKPRFSRGGYDGYKTDYRGSYSYGSYDGYYSYGGGSYYKPYYQKRGRGRGRGRGYRGYQKTRGYRGKGRGYYDKSKKWEEKSKKPDSKDLPKEDH